MGQWLHWAGCRKADMALLRWLLEHHQFVMHQCFPLPFAFLFYSLAKRRCLSLTNRYLCVSLGGCVLAVVTMGGYSALLLVPAVAFPLLVRRVDHSSVHVWTFGLQMLWQTSWHLLLQYKEYYLQEPVCIRLFLAVSSLMLLTQRLTSLSLDLLDKRVILTFNSSWTATLLPLMGYLCSFTTLLGGPLCSYSRFVSQMEEMELKPSPNPLGVVLSKLAQVFALQCLRYFFVVLLKRNPFNPSDSTFMHGILWVWGLGLVLRIQYYSHWKISECLNNSAGFGFDDGPTGEPNMFSDGDIRTVELSTCMSEFARRWNATTASWLRRLVYTRCKRFPLYTTFGFSLWWHGLHFGHFVGFLTWAVTVHADYHIRRCLSSNSCALLRRVRTCLAWINTQMVISCVVVAVEFRTPSALRVLFSTSICLAPLCNIILLIILITLSKVN